MIYMLYKFSKATELAPMDDFSIASHMNIRKKIITKKQIHRTDLNSGISLVMFRIIAFLSHERKINPSEEK